MDLFYLILYGVPALIIGAFGWGVLCLTFGKKKLGLWLLGSSLACAGAVALFVVWMLSIMPHC